MLEKIVQIKNVGRFQNYSASGDVSFRKLTLVYAENGRGKTTLCAILRSLQSGHAEFIRERKTLASTDSAFVHIRLNGDSCQFNNDAWTALYPDIFIFDPVFVNDNVYSGDYVEHEHKKNLYKVIVGVQGVKLAMLIEDLDGQIRDVNTDLRSKKEAVTRHLPSGTTLEDFLQWQPVQDIEVKLREKSNEISARERTAERLGEIQSKSILEKIRLPEVPSDIIAILAKQITDIVTVDRRGRWF
ncbi:MAG: hypothetical protein FJ106_07185 [Deltaproteobacteria bacterium]|nr:hypothetical protein [Deltaproteobacteria bacterium]